MYLGTNTNNETIYTDHYSAALGRSLSHPRGVVAVTRHQYRCETCGHTHGFTEQALEPFYCGACQTLVAITTEGRTP